MDDATTASSSLFEHLEVGGIVSALLVLAITWILVSIMTGSAARLGDRFVDKRLVLHQTATAARFLVWSLGAVLAVRALNLSREVLLTMTGAAAVTIGFALKDLAASVLAGLTIIVDRPFQVGDRVSFGGFYGEITGIGLRSVRLTTLDDNLITIPNNKFLTDIVSSGNAGALDMQVQMDFLVGVDQDIDLAKKLVTDCMVSNRYVYTEKPWVVLVNQVIQDRYFAVRLRAKAYVLDVKYEKAYESDVTQRVLRAFREHGVRPPRILGENKAAEPASLEHTPPPALRQVT